jgi:hypothetical protein
MPMPSMPPWVPPPERDAVPPGLWSRIKKALVGWWRAARRSA